MDEVNNEDAQPPLQSVLIKTILNLEEIDTNLFRGAHVWNTGQRSVYGGQVLGQALVAAKKTVPDHVHVHSLHCYFIRPGNKKKSILYHVERTRDGKSFCSRSIEARQDGQTIFTMQASYHKTEESPIEYQTSIPSVPHPEELKSHLDVLESLLMDKDALTRKQKTRRQTSLLFPVEYRPIDPLVFLSEKNVKEPKMCFWVRTKGYVGDTDQNIHRCIAAYISDYGLLKTAGIIWPGFIWDGAASLDHSMWFHAPFRTDEWMLYECECTREVGGRALIFGRLWRLDGVLAASVAQEGIIRGHFKHKL